MEINNIYYCVKRFKVKSKSNPNSFHHLELLSNGKIICDCYAGVFNRDCRHKKLVKEKLQKYEQTT